MGEAVRVSKSKTQRGGGERYRADLRRNENPTSRAKGSDQGGAVGSKNRDQG